MNLIEKKISALVVLGLTAVFSFALVLPAQAGALVGASTTPSVKIGGLLSSHTISFELASGTLSTQMQIRIIFPSGFSVPSTIATSSISASLTDAASVVATATVSAQEITLQLADGTAAIAGDTLQFSGIQVRNSYFTSSLILGIETRGEADDLADQASTSPAIYIFPGSDSGTPTQVTLITVGAPSTKITSPVSGQVIAAGQSYLIKGTASDTGVYDVSKVEVSVDNGSTWVIAELTKVSAGSFTWEYAWADPVTGSYTVKTRATDTAGNAESPGIGVSVTVGAAAPSAVPVPTTASELQATITQLRQQLVNLLQQLVQLLTQQLQGLTGTGY